MADELTLRNDEGIARYALRRLVGSALVFLILSFVLGWAYYLLIHRNAWWV